MTPETIVQLRPDHSPTPSTTEMEEMSEVFLKQFSNRQRSGNSDMAPMALIASKYIERDILKAWQSAVTNFLSRNVDWRGLSRDKPYYDVFQDELRNSSTIKGTKALDTFIKQYFRESHDVSELAPTQEDEA